MMSPKDTETPKQYGSRKANTMIRGAARAISRGDLMRDTNGSESVFYDPRGLRGLHDDGEAM